MNIMFPGGACGVKGSQVESIGMSEQEDILSRVLDSSKRRILYLPHAVRQMSRPDRMITTSDVRRVVESGELLEDYPDDPRGHSCLLLGRGEDGRVVHIVCAPKEEYLAIITAYVPSPGEWEDDLRTRKKR